MRTTSTFRPFASVASSDACVDGYVPTVGGNPSDVGGDAGWIVGASVTPTKSTPVAA